MCDEEQLNDNERLAKERGLTRRQLGTLAAGVSVAMMLPQVVNALDVTEAEVEVQTPDGKADCYFVHPATGKYPGVILWPDIMGIRPAFKAMGKRLAESGYSVLVINPYYRTKKAPVVEEGAGFDKLRPLAATLNPTTQETDAKAFVAYLDSQASVDTNRKVGTMGYCMTGSFAIRTAATVPDRVGAVASFHGGGLVGDAPSSPHLLIPQTKASFLIAIAENDDQQTPDHKTVLKDSFAKAGKDAEVEVYAGAMHGWCPPDSSRYNEAQAERAWARLLVLFDKALA